MKQIINHEFEQHSLTLKAMPDMINAIEKAAHICINALNNGNKILLFGNGGSAADAQHIAAELVGRYKIERQGLAAIALTTDTSALTSIGNDYGYDFIFSRQVEALANKNDVLIGISTGGSSQNVINGLKIGKEIGCALIGLSGRGGGAMNQLCDVNLVIPATDTPRIQEMHILVGHTLCHLIEQK